MSFFEILKKYQFIILLFLIFLNYKSLNAEESKVKKIIIDDNLGNGRLLSPPTMGDEKNQTYSS